MVNEEKNGECAGTRRETSPLQPGLPHPGLEHGKDIM